MKIKITQARSRKTALQDQVNIQVNVRVIAKTADEKQQLQHAWQKLEAADSLVETLDFIRFLDEWKQMEAPPA